MLIRLIAVLSFLLVSPSVSACFNATQHKIFPIGIKNDEIIALKAHFHRTHTTHNDKNTKEKVKWIVKYTINIYDSFQNLKSETNHDEEIVYGSFYKDQLTQYFQQIVQKVKSDYGDIEFFQPQYISFCDFQKKCNRLRLVQEHERSPSHFVYDNTYFEVDQKQLSSAQINEATHEMLASYYISSVRIFQSSRFNLIIAHLATGHEVSMGWIGDHKIRQEGENAYTSVEKIPAITFDTLQSTCYQEPLLHHGFGSDFIFIQNR